MTQHSWLDFDVHVPNGVMLLKKTTRKTRFSLPWRLAVRFWIQGLPLVLSPSMPLMTYSSKGSRVTCLVNLPSRPSSSEMATPRKRLMSFINQ